MKQYIVYYGSGGLSHMMSGLFFAIYMAKSTNRVLIIHLHDRPVFPFKISKYFNIYDKVSIQEHWEGVPNHYKFFQYSVEDLKKYENFGYKQKKNSGEYYYGDYLLNNPDAIKKNLTQDIFPIRSYYPNFNYTNIKLHLSIRNIVKRKCPPIKGRYISIHFRNTDLKYLTIEEASKRCLFLSKKHKINIIYLATDDYSAYDKLRQLLPSRIKLIQYIVPDNYNGKAIHLNKKDKYELTINSFCDMFMILKSQYFIPCVLSGFSKWLSGMMKKQNNIFNIVSNTKIFAKEKNLHIKPYPPQSFFK